VSDGRALRTDELGAVAVVNDAIRSPSEDSLAALRAYDIEPVLWSDRHERLPLLNGH